MSATPKGEAGIDSCDTRTPLAGPELTDGSPHDEGSARTISFVPAEEAGATVGSITLNLITGGLGIGLLSLPWSMAGASLIPGLLTIAAILALNGFTIMILIEGAEKYNVFDLGALLAKLPGRIGKVAEPFTTVSVWANLFFTQVGYTGLLAGAVTTVGEGTFLEDRNLAIVIVSVVILPAVFFDQSNLNFTSGIAVAVNMYIFGVMISEFDGVSDVCLVGFGRGSIAMVSVMFQAVVVQMCVMPMYKELENRSPQKFRRAVVTAFTVLFVVFAAFCIVGYATWGSLIATDVLKSLPKNAWGKAGHVCAGVCVAGTYPIFAQAMIAPAANMDSPHKNKIYAIAAFGTVGITMVVSFFVTDLTTINIVCGATACICFVAIAPSIVGLYLLESRGPLWNLTMICLMVFGTIGGILGLIFQQNEAKDLAKGCLLPS